jgi:hypothetical protein
LPRQARAGITIAAINDVGGGDVVVLLGKIGMTAKTNGYTRIAYVWLGLNFEEAALDHTEESYASETYAVELCAREKAHLSVFLAAPIFKIPGMVAGLFPMANAPADEVNAIVACGLRRIARAVKSADVATASARPNDVIHVRPADWHRAARLGARRAARKGCHCLGWKRQSCSGSR